MPKDNLYISETFVNRDRNAMFGESGIYEAFTDETGKLFKSLQKEYGRCISRVFIDQKDGPSKAIGWVFEKRMLYEDARSRKQDSFYMREVWVTVYTGPEVVTKTRAPFAEID